jgi:diguanylate cyclase (GGDEF)-like protein/PAS domain S-box-containing protein
MRLSDFLREKIELILAQWDEFAGQLLSPGPLSAEVLRDHARGIVEAIASDLDNAQSELQQLVKSRGLAPPLMEVSEAEKHGSARFAEGYDVNQAMAEFRALRATVLRLFGAHQKLPQADEITRFNEAIDQALAESLARFTALKNRQTRLFEVLLSNSPDLNYIVEPGGTLIYANNAFADAFGLRLAGLIGQSFFALCGPYVGDIDQRIRKVAVSGKIHRDEMRVGTATGEERSFEYLLVPVLDPQGRCEAVAGSARDITERKAAEEQVRHSANYDSLTDLANRGLFRERLHHELRHAARNGLRLSLLFIDLDRFKEINDQLGHGAGDQLLKEAAGRIKACVRDTDTVARLGGDEFTVILTDVTDAAHIDNIAAEIIAELRRPFLFGEGTAAVSASIGITVFPGDGGTADELVRNADEAMYAAKNAGRDQYRFFTPAMRGVPG